MERPQGHIEQPLDEYDHELTKIQSDAIALADELLKHKPEGTSLTFVDMVLEGDSEEMLAEIQAGPLASLLAVPDEQLAIESDGSYYPVIDFRKENATFAGIGLRVWGWDHDKFRYTSKNAKKPPYEYKEYPGEIDKTRQLELSMSYMIGDESATESLSIYVGSSQRGYVRASSQIHMMAYAETGYEGHGGRGDKDMSDETIEWFLEFIAKNIGDQPKSIGDVIKERLARIRADAERHGVLDAVNDLVAGTWDAQAEYLMSVPTKMLDGQSIAEALHSAETAPRAAEVARVILQRWNDQISLAMDD